MKVTQIPYKAPRKLRNQESMVSCVKWKGGDMLHFQWFKRDTAAVKFLNTLLAQGTAATLTQKGNV